MKDSLFSALSSCLFVLLLCSSGCGCGDDDDSADNGGDDDDDDDDDGDDVIPQDLVDPENVQYQGAFRLPVGPGRPLTFEYGGNAMTFRPGSGDDAPGTLYISGHDRLPYGELPDGGQVAEVSIPTPVVADSIEDLPTASIVQDFTEITNGVFDGLDEIPRMGMQYLYHPATGPKIHLTWGAHFQEPPAPSQAFFDPDLSDPQTEGAWYIAGASLYSVNDYMFEIPGDWADEYAHSRVLATGRYRDGGWSGKGPTIFAYVPWLDDAGSLASPDGQLAATTLLLYESSEINDGIRVRSLDGYQNADEWNGAAWLTTPSDTTAVAIAGTKGIGAKHWYGYIHPDGPEFPCVEVELVDQFVTCWNDDGTPCPESDLTGCEGATSYRGWWSARFEAWLIFFDPADLARVALGEMEPHEPQPYTTLTLDEFLFMNPADIEVENLGWDVQRRYRLGSVAFDREGSRLFVMELFADGAQPVIHVFEFL